MALQRDSFDARSDIDDLLHEGWSRLRHREWSEARDAFRKILTTQRLAAFLASNATVRA